MTDPERHLSEDHARRVLTRAVELDAHRSTHETRRGRAWGRVGVRESAGAARAVHGRW